MREPTAWINKERDMITFDNLFPEMTPLYEKREWVELTVGEVIELERITNHPREFAQAIDAKLREKNG